MYFEEKLRAAEALRTEIIEIEKRIELMRVTVDLSDHPLWERFKDGLTASITAKNNKLLGMLEDGDLAVLDRKRSNLAAEIRLLDFIKTSPDRFKVSLQEMSAQIAQKAKLADDLEQKYGFLKKGVKRG